MGQECEWAECVNFVAKNRGKECRVSVVDLKFL